LATNQAVGTILLSHFLDLENTAKGVYSLAATQPLGTAGAEEVYYIAITLTKMVTERRATANETAKTVWLMGIKPILVHALGEVE